MDKPGSKPPELNERQDTELMPEKRREAIRELSAADITNETKQGVKSSRMSLTTTILSGTIAVILTSNLVYFLTDAENKQADCPPDTPIPSPSCPTPAPEPTASACAKPEGPIVGPLSKFEPKGIIETVKQSERRCSDEAPYFHASNEYKEYPCQNCDSSHYQKSKNAVCSTREDLLDCLIGKKCESKKSIKCLNVGESSIKELEAKGKCIEDLANPDGSCEKGKSDADSEEI